MTCNPLIYILASLGAVILFAVLALLAYIGTQMYWSKK